MFSDFRAWRHINDNLKKKKSNNYLFILIIMIPTYTRSADTLKPPAPVLFELYLSETQYYQKS